MRILVTGSHGQLGGALVRTLSSSAEIVQWTRSSVDFSEPSRLEDALDHAHPDLILNAAAYTAVDRAEAEPDLARRVNSEAPGIIARYAQKAKIRLIHFSTDFVFDGQAVRPYREDDPTEPLNVYGRTKLDGEQAVVESGAHAINLRTSWLYSNGPHNFVGKILERARQAQSLRVVTDETGSPTFADDLARVTAQLVHAPWPFRGTETFHLANSGTTTRFEFAAAIVALGFEQGLNPLVDVAPVATVPKAGIAKRPPFSALDSEKMLRTFGYRSAPWRESLQRCIAKWPRMR